MLSRKQLYRSLNKLKKEIEKDKIDLNKKVPIEFITKIMNSKGIETSRTVKDMIKEIKEEY